MLQFIHTPSDQEPKWKTKELPMYPMESSGHIGGNNFYCIMKNSPFAVNDGVAGIDTKKDLHLKEFSVFIVREINVNGRILLERIQGEYPLKANLIKLFSVVSE